MNTFNQPTDAFIRRKYIIFTQHIKRIFLFEMVAITELNVIMVIGKNDTK